MIYFNSAKQVRVLVGTADIVNRMSLVPVIVKWEAKSISYREITETAKELVEMTDASLTATEFVILDQDPAWDMIQTDGIDWNNAPSVSMEQAPGSTESRPVWHMSLIG